MTPNQYLCQRLDQILHNWNSDSVVFPTLQETLYPLSKATQLAVSRSQQVRLLQRKFPATVIVLEGQQTLQTATQITTLQSGELGFLPAGLALESAEHPLPRGQYRALTLEFSTALLERFRRAYPEKLHPLPEVEGEQQPLNVAFSVALSSRLAEALIHLTHSLSEGEASDSSLHEHHLMEVLLLLLQSNVRHWVLHMLAPTFIVQARFLIRANLASNWSLSKLAQAMDMSLATIKRRFQEAGMSYQQLLDQERMAKAIALLRQNDQSIAQIALACGYKSQSRFAARFRYHYQLTPSQARRQAGSLEELPLKFPISR